MAQASAHIDRLIVNTPFDPPLRHWQEVEKGRFELAEGRRPAGYTITDTRANTNRFVPLPEVEKIRARLEAWRAADYAGVTTVTRRLLEHWHDRTGRQFPFYFCQLEAIETLIWWVEAQETFKQGIHIQGDGGTWERLCNKMATGSGKTLVMGMIIAWQALNALIYPHRREFSRSVLVMTPGLTVKERLQVLRPEDPQNVYDAFNIAPTHSYRERLNAPNTAIVIENWHTLMPRKPPERSVKKLGPESDEAYTQRVLQGQAHLKDWVVINDEAHHAYRIPPELKSKRPTGVSKEDLEEATRWIEGLDRLHKTRRLKRCFDLSATPFAPTGKKATEESLYPWIVSDFSLNDAIEAGLVKTPRVVVRDDSLPVKWKGHDYRPRLYHLYVDRDVTGDLNRRAAPHESLPELVQIAYTLLGTDWRKTLEDWERSGSPVPPAMLTVCNRIETAKRIEHFFLKGDCLIPELNSPNQMLRVDSAMLEKAEQGEAARRDQEYETRLKEIVERAGMNAVQTQRYLELPKEELLRAIVDNVGKTGTPGRRMQNVVSVAMLSEGWDAKNVTHILGLRAFTSQLLCEQVVGRGLRRTHFDMDAEGRFLPEYVNVFGVPFTFLPHEGSGEPPPPPKPTTQVQVLEERAELEITWPNVVRVESVLKSNLEVDWKRVAPLALKPELTPTAAEMAPTLAGIQDVTKVSMIDLTQHAERFRMQHLVFHASRKAYERLYGAQGGRKPERVLQIIRIVERFLASDLIHVASLFHQEPLRKRILLAMAIDRVVGHICHYLREANTERLEPVFDPEYPLGSTGRMRTWYTSKPCWPTTKSHISHAVLDSGWEQMALYDLDHSDQVLAYAKNDHLNFWVLYLHNGAVRKYFPDYLVRLANGKILVLEIKGQPSDESEAKHAALAQWVEAVNQNGGFGTWCWDVAYQPSALQDLLGKHAKTDAGGRPE
jgi:type III restriction enzyme